MCVTCDTVERKVDMMNRNNKKNRHRLPHPSSGKLYPVVSTGSARKPATAFHPVQLSHEVLEFVFFRKISEEKKSDQNSAEMKQRNIMAVWCHL